MVGRDPRHGSRSRRPPSSTRQRHAAAWPPSISAGPRCRGERRTSGRRWGISARQNCGWRSRVVPTASRPASRAYVEDHLRAVTGGTYGSRCRRLGSPPVLPRGSSADTGRARRNRPGDGDTAEDRCSGGSGDLGGGRREPRGVRSGRWRCRSGTRSPTACDPSASLPGPLRHGRSGPGPPRRHHHRRPPNQHPRAPSSVKGKLAALVGTLDGGAVVRMGWSRIRRAAGWPAGLCSVVMWCCLLAWSSLFG